jgi:hypothetical protein
MSPQAARRVSTVSAPFTPAAGAANPIGDAALEPAAIAAADVDAAAVSEHRGENAPWFAQL